jgi:hypothetical protein
LFMFVSRSRVREPQPRVSTRDVRRGVRPMSTFRQDLPRGHHARAERFCGRSTIQGRRSRGSGRQLRGSAGTRLSCPCSRPPARPSRTRSRARPGGSAP